jgi:CheY-like chemotaxis protein
MSKRILVVEDQPDNRQIIRDMLAPTDYEITEAENGEEALAAIAKQRPDLILMDIQLPIMDGYTATSRIKADPALHAPQLFGYITLPIYCAFTAKPPEMEKTGGSASVEPRRCKHDGNVFATCSVRPKKHTPRANALKRPFCGDGTGNSGRCRCVILNGMAHWRYVRPRTRLRICGPQAETYAQPELLPP